MSFVTDEVVKEAVAASLHKAGDDVSPDNLDADVTAANGEAYRQIVGRFTGLGYTAAQAASWDRGQDFQLKLATYMVLIKQNGSSDQVGEWRAELDYYRRELAAVVSLESGGEVVTPGATATSRFGRGKLKTCTDMFVEDQCDPRRGRTSRF